MFTGIVQETGKILDIKKAKKASTFTVKTKSALKNKKIGQSIAVNGVCVTITEIKDKNFKFDAMPETLEKTNLGSIKKGSEINLEPALTLNQALDGHIVQGHVDTTGTVETLEKNKDRVILEIKFPHKINAAGLFIAQLGFDAEIAIEFIGDFDLIRLVCLKTVAVKHKHIR